MEMKMQREQRVTPVSAGTSRRTSGLTRHGLAGSITLLALLLATTFAAPVSAQAPQPGTPPAAPGVPPGNSPRAEGPAQATPDPEMSEEDEDDGEGCPYLGQPLELVV
jgi:hypothetical protein